MDMLVSIFLNLELIMPHFGNRTAHLWMQTMLAGPLPIFLFLLFFIILIVLIIFSLAPFGTFERLRYATLIIAWGRDAVETQVRDVPHHCLRW
jgi:hypothetical protein